MPMTLGLQPAFATGPSARRKGVVSHRPNGPGVHCTGPRAPAPCAHSRAAASAAEKRRRARRSGSLRTARPASSTSRPTAASAATAQPARGTLPQQPREGTRRALRGPPPQRLGPRLHPPPPHSLRLEPCLNNLERVPAAHCAARLLHVQAHDCIRRHRAACTGHPASATHREVCSCPTLPSTSRPTAASAATAQPARGTLPQQPREGTRRALRGPPPQRPGPRLHPPPPHSLRLEPCLNNLERVPAAHCAARLLHVQAHDCIRRHRAACTGHPASATHREVCSCPTLPSTSRPTAASAATAQPARGTLPQQPREGTRRALRGPPPQRPGPRLHPPPPHSLRLEPCLNNLERVPAAHCAARLLHVQAHDCIRRHRAACTGHPASATHREVCSCPTLPSTSRPTAASAATAQPARATLPQQPREGTRRALRGPPPQRPGPRLPPPPQRSLCWTPCLNTPEGAA